MALRNSLLQAVDSLVPDMYLYNEALQDMRLDLDGRGRRLWHLVPMRFLHQLSTTLVLLGPCSGRVLQECDR